MVFIDSSMIARLLPWHFVPGLYLFSPGPCSDSAFRNLYMIHNFMTLWNTVSPYIFIRHRPLSVAANTAWPDVFVVAKIQNSTHACTQSQRFVQTLLQVMSHVCMLCIVTAHFRPVWICLVYSTRVREIPSTLTLQWSYACKLVLPWCYRQLRFKSWYGLAIQVQTLTSSWR
jgi:hypothetical protein